MVAVIVLLTSAVAWQHMRLAAARARHTDRLSAPASALIRLIDAERERTGCTALKLNDALTASAQAHVADMAARGYVSQSSPDGAGPRERASRAGYHGWVVEILAAGIPAPREVFAQWANSGNPASARIVAEMTDCGYVSAGIGYSSAPVMSTFLPGIWVVDLGDR